MNVRNSCSTCLSLVLSVSACSSDGDSGDGNLDGTAGQGTAGAMAGASGGLTASSGGVGSGTGGVAAGGIGSSSGGSVVMSSGGAGTSTGGTSTMGNGGTGSGGAAGEAATGGADAGGMGGDGAGGDGAGGDGAAGGVGGEGGATAGSDCTSLPAVTDYKKPGPFGDAKMFRNVGPRSNYTLFRPDASLGKDGFRHPIATWGNGIATTPDMYTKTLTLIATHGFVIIACNDTQAERPCVSDGMDWLVEQNSASGAMQGKLDTSREVTIGYSWGGGAAIDTANRPNVKATVSLHGMPPRQSSAFNDMHAPLLLYTSTGDTFVTASGYVTPNYQKSTVQTFYATLNDPGAGHLYVVDSGAGICIGSLVGFGACETAAEEQAPTIAWLRYWACGDEGAKKFFFGDDCSLCSGAWTNPQRKMWQ